MACKCSMGVYVQRRQSVRQATAVCEAAGHTCQDGYANIGKEETDPGPALVLDLADEAVDGAFLCTGGGGAVCGVADSSHLVRDV